MEKHQIESMEAEDPRFFLVAQILSHLRVLLQDRTQSNP